MPQIRLATFNIENLLQRFNFYAYGQVTVERVLRLVGEEPEEANLDEYMMLRKSLYLGLSDDSRQMCAQAIRDTRADVVCLQEVDNKTILNDFHDRYIKKSTGINYGWRRLIEGNDNRGIDVAVMAKDRITVKSHAEHTFEQFDLFNDDLADYGLNPGDRIFRRDSLEVNLKVDDKPLTLFVCHLKSMSNGRDETIPVRKAETKAVIRIITEKFGNDTANSDWLILGDLNDYTHQNGIAVADSGLTPLFENDFSFNLVKNLPVEKRWTQFYPAGQSIQQLDYILVSPAIQQKNPNVKPDIIRSGQPFRVPGIENEIRYPRVGFDRPKASDHCPVAVEIEF
jgi:endonuclease/exonuclease/phosphatase family metal-dependent hydrolase